MWLRQDLAHFETATDPREWAERREIIVRAVERLRAQITAQKTDEAAFADVRRTIERATEVLAHSVVPDDRKTIEGEEQLSAALRRVGRSGDEREQRRLAILRAAMAISPAGRKQIAQRIRIGRTDDPIVEAMRARVSAESRAELLGVLDGTKSVQLPPEAASDDKTAIVAHATGGAEQPLPFRSQIQASFGHHDVSGIRSHQDEDAAEGARALGAKAFASADRVAFAGSPDLHTAAHEAAHVVQQQAGVALKSGAGESGDLYEREADAVADRVVAGKTAEPLLDQIASRRISSSNAAVQLRPDHDQRVPLHGPERYLWLNERRVWPAVADYLQRVSFPIPDPRLAWRAEAFFTASLVDAMKSRVDLHDPQQLLGLLHPANPYDAIEALVPVGHDNWVAGIGPVLGPLFQDAIAASLRRLGPRWVASAETKPEREGLEDEDKSLVAFGSLITSAPMDVYAARALTSGAVVELRGNQPKTKPNARDARPLRPIKHLEFQGARDRRIWNFVKAIDPPDATAEEIAAKIWAEDASASDGAASFQVKSLFLCECLTREFGFGVHAAAA